MAEDNRRRLVFAILAFFAIVPIAVRFARLPASVQPSWIRTLYGLQPDPHFLTARAWVSLAPALLVHAVRWQLLTAIGISLFAYALGIVAFRNNKTMTAAVAVAGTLCITASPLVVPFLASPTAPEDTIVLFLFLAMVAYEIGVIRGPLLLEAGLIVASVLESQLLIGAASLYCWLCALRRPLWSRIALPASLLAATAVRFTLHEPGFATTSSPENIAAIIAAILIFLVLPALVVAMRDVNVETRRSATRTALFSISLLACAPFSGPGAVVVAWIGASASFFLSATAISAAAPWPKRFVPPVIVLLLLLISALTFKVFGLDGSGENFDMQVSDLRAALSRDSAQDFTAACLSSGRIAPYALLDLGNMPFERLIPTTSALARTDTPIAECAWGNGGSSTTKILQAGRFSYISSPQIANAIAVSGWHDAESGRVQLQNGSVFPKTTLPIRGHGAFVEDVTALTGSAPSVTVIAGFAYRVRCPVRNIRQFSFAAANPLEADPHADPVRFEVNVDAPKVSYVAIAKTLVRAPQATTPGWRYYSVTLPSKSPCDSITFRASAPAGSAFATWVTFVAPVTQ